MITSSNSSPTLLRSEVQDVLERLHTLADSNDSPALRDLHASGFDRKSATPAQEAVALREVLLPISREVGRFLYGLARSISARRVVEFGTSYGVSTTYFAAALRDNGGGVVVGSELEPTKVAKANQHLAEAGLSELVDIRAGDALHTLKDTGGAIDLLFLDGWKGLYLDLLRVIGKDVRPGGVVLADDLNISPERLAPYLAYVRNPVNGFVSVMLPIGDGMEYSVKL